MIIYLCARSKARTDVGRPDAALRGRGRRGRGSPGRLGLLLLRYPVLVAGPPVVVVAAAHEVGYLPIAGSRGEPCHEVGFAAGLGLRVGRWGGGGGGVRRAGGGCNGNGKGSMTKTGFPNR